VPDADPPDYLSDDGTPSRSRSRWEWNRIRDVLEDSREHEAQRLTDHLEQIERQLDTRKDVHRERIDRLEAAVDEYVDELRWELRRPFGGNTEAREEAQERLAQLYDQIGEVRRRFWNDRQQLLEERRRVVAQLRGLESVDLSQLLQGDDTG
jgi:hypothetical protein